MAIKKDVAERKLQQIIQANSEHQDFDRVKEYAVLMRRLISGEGIEHELKQFVLRETKEMFEQRVTLTQIVTKSICSTLMTPAYKIPRVKPMVKKIDFQTNPTNVSSEGTNKAKQLDVEKKKELLNAAIASYYGKSGVDGYLQKRFIPLMYLDPNGFIVTTFDQFDNRYDKAKPYPTYISCDRAIHFDIADNELNWLVVRDESEYMESVLIEEKPTDRVADGKTYYIYTEDTVIEYRQINAKYFQGAEGEYYTFTPDGGKALTLYKIDSTRVFVVTYYEPKAGGIQAMRIGTFLDEATDGRTCVSPIDPALPYLMKSIKVCSELDISETLHVFLQKVCYVPQCPGESLKLSCNNGFRPDGERCSICGGTGKEIHTSSQDVITFALPKDPADLIPLDKIIHYQDLPIDIVEHLDKRLDKCELKAVKAVYNSELFSTDTIVATATAKNIDMQSVYDALYPIAQQYSLFWVHTVRLIANMIDLAGIIAEHQFPKDFKFRSIEDLLTMLKLANDGGVPHSVKQDISNDIAELVFQDRPDELKKMQVKQIFNPFDGKGADEINLIIANNDCTARSKLLWAEWARIWTELEQEQLAVNRAVWFYDLDYTKQKVALDKKIIEIKNEIEADTPKAVPLGGGIPPGATDGTGNA